MRRQAPPAPFPQGVVAALWRQALAARLRAAKSHVGADRAQAPASRARQAPRQPDRSRAENEEESESIAHAVAVAASAGVVAGRHEPRSQFAAPAPLSLRRVDADGSARRIGYDTRPALCGRGSIRPATSGDARPPPAVPAYRAVSHSVLFPTACPTEAVPRPGPPRRRCVRRHGLANLDPRPSGGSRNAGSGRRAEAAAPDRAPERRHADPRCRHRSRGWAPSPSARSLAAGPRSRLSRGATQRSGNRRDAARSRPYSLR